MYFGEYYRILRKILLWCIKYVVWVKGHFIPNFTFPYAIVLRSSSGEMASLMIKNL